MLIHRVFLLLWAAELSLFPWLTVLDLGFGYNFGSNYYLRFSYLAAFFLGSIYHLMRTRAPLITPLSALFLVVAILGALKGIVEHGVSGPFASQVFYCVMPVVMISYGCYFFKAMSRSRFLRRRLLHVMYISFYMGVAAVAVFGLCYVSGRASYNAVGIWNFIFAGPFLLFQSHGMSYFMIATMATLVAGKRGVVLVFVTYIALLFLLLKLKSKVGFVVAMIAVVGIAVAVLGERYNVFGRIEQTASLVADEELDAASAGRWQEARSALEYLGRRWDHYWIGAGFGATFEPWPDKPNYFDYRSHYVHTGPISYIWLGGLPFSLAAYFILICLGFRLLTRAVCKNLSADGLPFLFWLWGIIVISMFGAVLMNNSWLWFIVGLCLALEKSSRRPAGRRIATRTLALNDAIGANG